jgi:hypothetical protein
VETRQYDDLAQWLVAARALGATAAAVQEVDEIRPKLLGNGVHVGPMRYADVIAYVDGVVVKTRIPEHPRELAQTLAAEGFTVRRRWKNIG